MKDDILGETYDLSLVFVGSTRARAINKATRNKEYIPNVLAFPFDNTHGEIVLTPAHARTEAAKFGLSYRGYIGFLYIHALLHLKGYDHGVKMEQLEQEHLQYYQLS